MPSLRRLPSVCSAASNGLGLSQAPGLPAKLHLFPGRSLALPRRCSPAAPDPAEWSVFFHKARPAGAAEPQAARRWHRILARDTALRRRPEVLPAPRASREPGDPTPSRKAGRPRGPRSRSPREPFGPCAAPVARLLQQVVLVLRGRSVPPSPADLCSAPASASAAPRPSERSPARRCGRAPGLPLRPARPLALRAPARPLARPAAGPLLRTPRAQRPGLRGSGGERRAAAPRRGPAWTPRLGCSWGSPALRSFSGYFADKFWSTRSGSCVRFGSGSRRRRESEGRGGTSHRTAPHRAALLPSRQAQELLLT